MVVDLSIALVLWVLGYGLFGRFITPQWKIVGKLLFYIGVAAGLARTPRHRYLELRRWAREAGE